MDIQLISIYSRHLLLGAMKDKLCVEFGAQIIIMRGWASNEFLDTVINYW